MEETKKKRGRKPLNLKKDIDQDTIKSHVTELKEHQECLIVNIPLEEDGDLHCASIVAENTKSDILHENSQLKIKIQELSEHIKKLESTSKVTLPQKATYRSFTTELPISYVEHLENPLLCWWCCHSFEPEQRVVLPHAFENGVFSVSGNFCSFSCVLSYNFNLKDVTTSQRTTLINLMYKKITDSDDKIIPAPPKELLKAFGGPLSIEEYRNDSITIGLERRVFLPPYKSILYVVDEDNRTYTKVENKNNLYIPLNKLEVNKAKAELRLKRTQPIKSKHISLESSLGLLKKSDITLE